MMVFTSPVSVYFLALTSFLIPHEELSTFPDQYIFVLQYWVSSSSQTAISGEFSVTEATFKNISRQLVGMDMLIFIVPLKVFPKIRIPAWAHCLMCGDRRGMLRVLPGPGPGPPQAETH